MAIRGDHDSPDWGRGGAALGIALILHGIFWWGLSHRKLGDVVVSKLSVLDVTLIQNLPNLPEPKAPEPVTKPKPVEKPKLTPQPKPQRAPIPPPLPAPVILATPETVTPTDPGAISIAPQPSQHTNPGKTYIPSQWALEPALSEDNLQGFAEDIDCLRSLSPDCTVLRKDVFAKQQLTETELVWTKKYAHTGLPAEFYGMSERQIRRRLGVPIAGENGKVIIPGILVIDGGIWDAIHGVNKRCTWRPAAPAGQDMYTHAGDFNGGGGVTQYKDCGRLRPAAKDEKYAIQNGETENE